jgi:hypothetical protein
MTENDKPKKDVDKMTDKELDDYLNLGKWKSTVEEKDNEIVTLKAENKKLKADYETNVKEYMGFLMNRFSSDGTWFKLLRYMENNPDWVKKAGKIVKSTDACYAKMSLESWKEKIEQEAKDNLLGEIEKISRFDFEEPEKGKIIRVRIIPEIGFRKLLTKAKEGT